MSKVATKSNITLKGSVEIVTEFFGAPPAPSGHASARPVSRPRALPKTRRRARFPAGYSINSILYQRGIYPPETFRRVNKYGLTMLVTTDDALNAYLENVLTQLSRAPAAPIPPAWAPRALPHPSPAQVCLLRA